MNKHETGIYSLLREQAGRIIPLVAACALFMVAVTGASLWACYRSPVSPWHLTRDPLGVCETVIRGILERGDAPEDVLPGLDVPFYFGLLSNLGVLFWAVAAGAGAVGFLVLRGTKRAREARWFLWGTTLTGALAVDDLFMVHEKILPVRLGLPEETLFVAYAVLGLVWFGVCWKETLRSDFLILVLALIALGMSVAMDVLGGDLPQQAFLEDMPKLAGALFWCAYFVHETARRLRPGFDPAVQGVILPAHGKAGESDGQPEWQRDQ